MYHIPIIVGSTRRDRQSINKGASVFLDELLWFTEAIADRKAKDKAKAAG